MTQGTVSANISGSVIQIGGSNVSAFGDIIAVEPTPLVQLDFVYGINIQTGATTVANGGTVDTSAGRLRIQSGTNTAGSGIFQSVRLAKYRPGQGMQARFTAAFAAGAASSTQIVGAGTGTDGYFFGYNGFVFGILYRNAGVDTWYPQSAWNGDTCDGLGASNFDWNPTLGNVMQIQYPFLGYGNITFWVQNPANSQWVLCHTIRYTNSSASIQLSNPTLRFYAQAVNTGSATNKTLYVGSAMISLTGRQEYLQARWAIDSAKTLTTEACIVNLRNATTYNGAANTGILRLTSISACYAHNTSAYAVVRLKKGVTIGGTPAYTPISGSTADNGVTITSGNSVTSFDTAGTTVTGGAYVWQVNMCQAGNAYADVSTADIQVYPGEILTISGFATSSAVVAVGVNWVEEV